MIRVLLYDKITRVIFCWLFSLYLQVKEGNSATVSLVFLNVAASLMDSEDTLKNSSILEINDLE